MERGILTKVLGSWDRDGTPIAGTTHDDWYWTRSNLFHSHHGEAGFLNQTIIQRCSVACENVSEEECGTKQGNKKSGTVGAESDWFVCRCNSGVLQLAGSETQTW